MPVAITPVAITYDQFYALIDDFCKKRYLLDSEHQIEDKIPVGIIKKLNAFLAKKNIAIIESSFNEKMIYRRLILDIVDESPLPSSVVKNYTAEVNEYDYHFLDNQNKNNTDHGQLYLLKQIYRDKNYQFTSMTTSEYNSSHLFQLWQWGVISEKNIKNEIFHQLEDIYLRDENILMDTPEHEEVPNIGFLDDALFHYSLTVKQSKLIMSDESDTEDELPLQNNSRKRKMEVDTTTHTSEEPQKKQSKTRTDVIMQFYQKKKRAREYTQNLINRLENKANEIFALLENLPEKKMNEFIQAFNPLNKKITTLLNNPKYMLKKTSAITELRSRNTLALYETVSELAKKYSEELEKLEVKIHTYRKKHKQLVSPHSSSYSPFKTSFPFFSRLSYSVSNKNTLLDKANIYHHDLK